MGIDLNLTDVEIAWIAGLLEGEGSFCLDARSAKRYNKSTSPPSPTLQIAMVDEDIIQRLAEYLNKNYSTLTRKTIKEKTVYKLNVGDRATLTYLYPRICPFLGKRRKIEVQKGIDALNAWEEWYAAGGRSEMAKEGPKKQQTKNNMGSKSQAFDSDDMIPPN